MTKYKCTVCGYISDDEAPELCPKCGAPKEKFENLPEDAAKLIDRARYTNQLHMDMIAIMEEVVDIATEGIEDNLDPACLSVFQKAKKSAIEFVQMSRAEIQGHVGKGKWG